MLINGERRPGQDGVTFDLWNPATGAVIGEAPLAEIDDVDDAVQSAWAAFPEWAARTPVDRAGHLRRLAAAMEPLTEDLARLDTLGSGNPLAEMRTDISRAIRSLEFYTSLIGALEGSSIPASTDHLHYTRNEPFGVTARIVPYNHPLLFAATRLAAPLLAGNTVVLKPGPQAPQSAIRLAECINEVFPPGVVNIITGGADTGRALVRHPQVRRIGFIGSLAAGLSVMEDATAGGHIKSVSLELGGKNAMILFPDVHPAVAARAVVKGLNVERCQGQSCGATSRVFVHRSLHAEVVDRVAAAFGAFRLGDPLDPETTMGPLISEGHRARVLGAVAVAVAEGARLVSGGRAVESLPGFFMEPAALDDVAPDSTLGQQEVFGPVVGFTGWDDYDDMIEMVNSTRYGLTASIWTGDLAQAHTTAGRVRAGYVWINTVEHRWPGIPWGGMADSGLGREYSREEILSYTQVKAVNVSMADPLAAPQEDT
jgi:2-formylbenzoate dehydrogenase